MGTARQCSHGHAVATQTLETIQLGAKDAQGLPLHIAAPIQKKSSGPTETTPIPKKIRNHTKSAVDLAITIRGGIVIRKKLR